VKELENCWLSALSSASSPIIVDLEDVSFIDAAGKELLDRMYGRGTKLMAAGVETRAIIERIKGRKR
jgi:hypothetical protein